MPERNDEPVRIADVMTADPIVCGSDTTLREVAARMRDADVGDVLVDGDGDGSLRGIVTDRDLVVRAVAEGRDAATTRVGDICSGELVTVSPGDRIEVAVNLMREHAVRRIPVIDGGRAVGVVSLGDLAVDREPRSPLADISAADPDD